MSLVDCPCGCGERFEPGPKRRQYATAACRQRVYKQRRETAPVTSPGPVRDGRGCPGGPRSGPNARSGATVSAGRMVRVLSSRLNLSEPSAVSVVMDAMTLRAQAQWKRPA